ncbi:MAG: hypothetical protein RBU25_19835, partial [Lentisphaeria bacterium]|nr:hypothetical protein [Lentisphaeria bacterium]
RGLAASATGLDDATATDILAGYPGVATRAGAAARADWLLLVLVDARFTSELYGQFFAEAGGRVELIESATGRRVNIADLTVVKGGHVSRRNALNRAASQQREPALVAVDKVLATLPRHDASVR